LFVASKDTLSVSNENAILFSSTAPEVTSIEYQDDQ
jgi:hypothetical protein